MLEVADTDRAVGGPSSVSLFAKRAERGHELPPNKQVRNICVLIASQVIPRSSAINLTYTGWRRGSCRKIAIKTKARTRVNRATHLRRIASAWYIAVRLRSVLCKLGQFIPTICNPKCVVKKKTNRARGPRTEVGHQETSGHALTTGRAAFKTGIN